VWGDSHAMVMSPAVDAVCKKHGVCGVQATHASTVPVLNFASKGVTSLGDDSIKFNQLVFDYLQQKHITNVILIARWSRYVEMDGFRRNLTTSLDQLNKAGIEVYLVKDVPAADFDVPHAAALTALRGGNVNSLGASERDYENENRKVDELFRQVERSGVTVLDPAAYLPKTNGLYQVAHDQQLYYVDSHHLSFEGAKLVETAFEPVFRAAQIPRARKS